MDTVHPVEKFERLASKYLGDALQRLIETRHLYQTLEVESGLLEQVDHALNDYPSESSSHPRAVMEVSARSPWELTPSYGRFPLPGVSSATNAQREAVIRGWPMKVMLWCPCFSRVQPFKFETGANLIDREDGCASISVGAKCIQLVAYAFQCQACTAPPQVFLLRRNGSRVSIEGRSPIERPDAPPDLPEPHAQYFRDSVLAYQCGQVLPAVCMLRVFIEQFVRSGANAAKWDLAIAQYAKTLPVEFKARFGTLEEQYADLSAAIHDAEADVVLYETTKGKVEKHFQARRAYDLDPA